MFDLPVLPNWMIFFVDVGLQYLTFNLSYVKLSIQLLKDLPLLTSIILTIMNILILIYHSYGELVQYFL